MMGEVNTMARSSDEYGSFGSVVDVLPTGGATPSMNVRANPNDSGAQIGAAIEGLGNTAQALTQKYQQIATEAKVNDDYANKYVPAAAALRNKYDQLQGQDKIHGYDGYIKSLQDLNKQFTTGYSLNGQQMMSGQINRHLTNEIMGAQADLAKSQIEFSNRAAADKIQADSGYAAQNYNNPEIVDQVMRSNDAMITMQHIDNGIEPNSEENKFVIDEAKRAAKGEAAIGMINSAISRGDATAAKGIRQTYAKEIPGYQQLSIDNTLHAESMRQTSVNAAKALASGNPIPPTIGATPFQVQAAVANAAQRAGLDPNIALTVASIESSMGQNLGKRGDIGQTGKGGNIHEQSDNMVTELKKAQTIANNTLGRDAEPWEIHAVYEQGAGGGPALLNADPKSKAIDVLRPLYKNPSDARDAILNNGGNLTMSAGDMLNLIHKKYEANSARSVCEIPPEGISIGDAIILPHVETGPTVQPAATPRQALNNYDEKFPDMMARANSIPNLETRANVIRALKSDRENLAASSMAYSSSLINKAHQLAADPKFTSIEQVPAEMASSLLTDHPDTMHYLELRAEYNLNKGSGGITPDMKTYGPAMFTLMRDIHSGKIKSTDELISHLPKEENPGDITLAGYDKLVKEFTKDPESQSDGMMKTQALKVIKRQLSGEDDYMKDPKGEALFSQALPKLFKAIEEGQLKGLTIGELTDPSNTNWIGNAVQGLKRSPAQMAMDIENAMDSVETTTTENIPPKRTFSDIYREYNETTDADKKMALKREAKQLGLLPSSNKSLPKAPINKE